MPELRKDPIVDRWVIISTDRGRRPSDYLETIEERNEFSPFAPGNEEMTPPEIMALRPDDTLPNTPGWTLRVIPNKYPALEIEGEITPRGDGIYDMMNGVGTHEVIIETNHPEKRLDELTVEEIEHVFATFRGRITDLRQDPRLKYALIFKNHGHKAGATLKHSHSQLIATPMVPKRVREEIEGAQSYFDLKQRCIFCDIINQEEKDSTRLVYAEEHFVALAPFASRSPFETWILPREHMSNFESLSDEVMRHLAITVQIFLRKLNVALQTPSFNLVLHTAPLQEKDMKHYHWHIEVMPRLKRLAGFEWGSGYYINSTSPEEAATYLRDIMV